MNIGEVKICKPECDRCKMLFLSIFRSRSVLLKVGVLIYEITLTASFVSSPLLFGFVVIRNVGAKWKFIVLVQFQQTSDVCKSLHDVKTPQVSKEFVSLLCTLLFDCLGCLKGLCHTTRMREQMKTNLKKTAQLFQVVSEILEGCFYLSKSQPSLDS